MYIDSTSFKVSGVSHSAEMVLEVMESQKCFSSVGIVRVSQIRSVYDCDFFLHEALQRCYTETIKQVQQQTNKTLIKALLFGSEAHRVLAALSDNDSVGKGLVVDLNVERPVSAILRVLLDKVQVVYTGNLHAEKQQKSDGSHKNTVSWSKK